MMRALAIAERDLLKFFRSPIHMMGAMVIPLLQFVILGNAYGGKIHDARVGLVDHDHGSEARRIKESLNAITANAKTIQWALYADERQARQSVFDGKIDAVIIIPARFSADVLRGHVPELGLVIDNSDSFLSQTLTTEADDLVKALNQPDIKPRIESKVSLNVIELYPYIEYMKYLLPGSMALAMFVSVMVGGGILYVDDKDKGVHEGYLVTPITKLEMIIGLNLAGIVKAILSGLSIAVIGSLTAGLDTLTHFNTVCELIAVIVASAVALNGFMFLLITKVDDPIVPRTMIGILSTLLFFPSGAIYPIAAFPKWLKLIAVIDPFTYIVHGLRSVMLKGGGVLPITIDVSILFLVGIGSLIASFPLFKRSL